MSLDLWVKLSLIAIMLFISSNIVTYIISLASIVVLIFWLWLNQFFLQFEFSYYDFLLSSYSPSVKASDVVIIGYTEEDIRRFENSTISDQTLDSVLNSVLEADSALIGLDFLRDFINYPPLEDLFYNESSLYVSVSLLGDDSEKIYSLPNLDSSRWGDVSVPIDFDNVLRRVYLSVCYPRTKEGNCEGYIPSLPFQLAVSYLKQQGVSLERDADGYLKLGKASFPQVTENYGAYVNLASGGGYQYLMNWLFPLPNVQTFTVSSIIDFDYDPEVFRNKIVLIGTLSPSSGDRFTIPGGASIYGVESIAQQINFYLAAARGEVNSLVPVPFSWQLIWFIFCSLLPWCYFKFLITRFNRLSFWVLFSSFVNISVLLFISLICFQFNLWLPVFPEILSLFLMGLIQLLALFQVNHQRYVKHLEDSVVKLRQELDEFHQYDIVREKSESVSFLASKLAHELRNSVANLQGVSYLVKESLNELSEFYQDDEELLEATQNAVTLEQKISQLSVLLNDILKMSRCNLYQQPTAIDLNEFLNKFIENNVKKSEVSVLRDFDFNLKESVVVLETSLHYSLWNLTTNALNAIADYKEQGGYNEDNYPLLKFVTRDCGIFVEIKVCDNGIGVPPEYHDSLFSILFTNRKQGTGLGLYFVYESIVNVHKGKVFIDPPITEMTNHYPQTPVEGVSCAKSLQFGERITCFTIWLPKQFRGATA